jgi:hypothetical protein
MDAEHVLPPEAFVDGSEGSDVMSWTDGFGTSEEEDDDYVEPAWSFPSERKRMNSYYVSRYDKPAKDIDCAMNFHEVVKFTDEVPEVYGWESWWEVIVGDAFEQLNINPATDVLFYDSSFFTARAVGSRPFVRMDHQMLVDAFGYNPVQPWGQPEAPSPPLSPSAP